MTESTAQTRAVEELLAQRREADRRPVRFGWSSQKKAAPATRRGPMSVADRAAREAAWRRDAGEKTSRFG
jgi:hypothetical protein